MTRNEVLSQAVKQCLKELYSYVYPSISWEEFTNKNEIYSKAYREWEKYHNAWLNREKDPKLWESFKENYKILDWEDKSREECIGPRPFEFYYLPNEIMKDICDSYVYAYQLDSQQELLNIIEILKNYCKEPIVDKYVERDGDNPGYRSYDHPNNLEKEIEKILFGRMSEEPGEYREESAQILQNKFFEFLDMAGKFYNWNRDLNSFNVSVYLGPSPNSNKEAVIKNWKKYKNKDIEIDDEQIKRNYYGEDFDE